MGVVRPLLRPFMYIPVCIMYMYIMYMSRTFYMMYNAVKIENEARQQEGSKKRQKSIKKNEHLQSYDVQNNVRALRPFLIVGRINI